MTVSAAFKAFLDNIKVSTKRAEKISNRYREITKKLNQRFRETDSESVNCLQVGSYGRYTGVKGISDLDMLYIMPDSLWERYRDDPSGLLSEVKEALIERYPNTDIRKDTLVVVVDFTDFKFEIQPVFVCQEGNDSVDSYKYPTTKDGGSYKLTKPRHEQKAMTEFCKNHGTHHRLLCKMLRAWKNNVGLSISGLLIDTLAYNFCTSNKEFDDCTLSSFDGLAIAFFQYLKDEPKQEYYWALGSNQQVKVKSPFQAKAKKAYKECIMARETTSSRARHDHWRNVFGKDFPKADTSLQRNKFSDTEEFIEDFYPVNVKYDLSINCIVVRDGYRPRLLREILSRHERVLRVRSLDFYIETTNVPKPYDVKWKVLNIGEEAERRNCIRGEIISSNKDQTRRRESSDFFGDHYVECYILKENVVVARDRISVPISHNE